MSKKLYEIIAKVMDISIDEINDKEFNIIFGQKQRAITPGQSVVVYESNVCLGGGIIKEPINQELNV